jgi:hypothetical protein
MPEAVFSIIAISLVGALAVPLAMLTLARVGLFEPIEFRVFGKRYTFARKNKEVSSLSGGTFSIFPNRQTAFAGAVSVVLTIGANGIQSSAIVTGSDGTLTIKDAA